MTKLLRPIILAGGSGTRLWPLSTEERPKQFLPIFKEFSLFDLSLQRLNKRSLFKKPIIVTSERYIDYVNGSLMRMGLDAEKIILEPEGKNTSPAITTAVMLALKKDPSEIFFVAPSDHYISINKNFHAVCASAYKEAKLEGLVLMGILPDRPSSEFGYISTDKKISLINKVNKFYEKPNLDMAKRLIEQPGIFWNSGMFTFNGAWFLKTLKKVDNEMYLKISKIVGPHLDKSNIFMPDVTKFSKLRNISFDVGFVDKIKEVSMVLLDAGWSDLGSWVSLSQLYREPDSSMTLFSKDAYVRQDKPWGYFKTLMESEVSKVKLLSVSPREKLSLQKHKRRKETWHIIKGSAKVTRDNEIFLMKIGESITIEKNQLHRLENETDEILEVIEIQRGSYFGEDDITRLEDHYGRADLH